MPVLGDPGHADMIGYLRGLQSQIGTPSAIIMVSAHWEFPKPRITSSPQPDLYFDYYGFPPETYEYTYGAPGSPELAQRLFETLTAAGLEPELDDTRGFDHGMFIPMMLMYPDGSVPVVQVSLLDGLDAESHIALGEALRSLTDDDVLVIGSGMSYHNMGGFGGAADPANIEFDAWLEDVCTASGEESARREALVDWASTPSARENHPREEHLVPLHVCYGVGGGAALRHFEGQVMGKLVAAYLWP